MASGRDEYRDALAAAHTRIEQLERENAALRRRRDGAPVTEAELEVYRIEGELLRVDMEWQTHRARFGDLDPRRRARRTRAGYVACATLGAFGVVMSVALSSPHAPALFPTLLLGGLAVVGALSLRWSQVRYRRLRVVYEAKRGALLARHAALRGDPRDETARVRVAADAEALAPDAHDVDLAVLTMKR